MTDEYDEYPLAGFLERYDLPHPDRIEDEYQNTCDECGSGGGGLCPGCKNDAEVQTR